MLDSAITAPRTNGRVNAIPISRSDARMDRGQMGIIVLVGLLLLAGIAVGLALRGMIPPFVATMPLQIAPPPTLAAAVAPVS